MRVLLTDNSTIISMWGCRENNDIFHKRLPSLTAQVWSKIYCPGAISWGAVAWSDANALGYCEKMLSVFDTRQIIYGTSNLLDKY